VVFAVVLGEWSVGLCTPPPSGRHRAEDNLNRHDQESPKVQELSLGAEFSLLQKLNKLMIFFTPHQRLDSHIIVLAVNYSKSCRDSYGRPEHVIKDESGGVPVYSLKKEARRKKKSPMHEL